MIISHKNRFIFIHCRKAAGSSIVTSLSKYLGPNDIQLSAINDVFSLNLLPPRSMIILGVRLITISQIVKLILRKTSLGEIISSNVKRHFKKKFSDTPQHASAKEIKEKFPEEWENYFKFCVIRNPIEKTISDYRWRIRKIDAPPSIDEYVQGIKDGNNLDGIVPKNHSNWNMYTIDDEVSVDLVIDFNFLNEDLKKAMDLCKIDWDGWLPVIKKAAPDKEPIKVSEQTKKKIHQIYKKEMEFFLKIQR